MIFKSIGSFEPLESILTTILQWLLQWIRPFGATLRFHDYRFNITFLPKFYKLRIYAKEWLLSKSTPSKTHDFQIHRFLGTLGAYLYDAPAVFVAMNQPFKILWTGAKMSRLFFYPLRRRRPNHDIAPLFFASGWGQQFLEDFWLCPITHLAFCNHTQRQHQLHQKRSIFSFFSRVLNVIF